MQDLAAGLDLVAVGFDPAPDLAAVADAVGWRGGFLVDAERRLYRRLGLRRAPWWRVWSPSTLAWYARAGSGARPADPDSATPTDVRRLGGDAVVLDGTVVRCWRPRTPVDRVDPAELVAVARDQMEIM